MLISLFLASIGILTFIFSLNRILVISLIILLLIGLFLAMSNVILLDIQTILVPAELRGRYFSTNQTLISIVIPLGITFSGVLSDKFGVIHVFYFISAIFIFSSILILLIKNLDKLRMTQKDVENAEK
jgi:MFS family permease